MYEAKAATFDSTTKLDNEHAATTAGANPYIDMGEFGSWVEFHVDHSLVRASSIGTGTTTDCRLSFRYSNGASNRQSRPCSVSINGIVIGALPFPSTISWTNWRYQYIELKRCNILMSEKITAIRLTATTEEGGPNLDSMEWTTTLSDGDSSSTLSPSSPYQPESKESSTKIRKCNYKYNKLPEGRITYGLDDGGCYLCTEQHLLPFVSVPSSGKTLTEQCQRLCDDDSQCRSFTVARPASLPSQLYHFGTTANCCLERREYPSGAFLHTTTTADENGQGMVLPPNRRKDCQLDSMCWTRYERIHEEGEGPCADFLEDANNPKPSKLMCSRVWEPTTYTDEDIQKAIDFINDGCQTEDNIHRFMLAKANARCKEEILAESFSVSIIVHSSGMLTYVTTG